MADDASLELALLKERFPEDGVDQYGKLRSGKLERCHR